ncbi:hypothetical protein TPA0905_05850 [Streptomyces olivaceus]|nr:hypothetical protein TPA0905_05850 [Streptomyces olivaceus]
MWRKSPRVQIPPLPQMPKGPVHWTGPFVLRAVSRCHTRFHTAGPTVPRDGQVSREMPVYPEVPRKALYRDLKGYRDAWSRDSVADPSRKDRAMRHTAATLGITATLLLAPLAPAAVAAESAPRSETVAVQQQQPAAATAPQAADDNDDDGSSGGWGLWGLLGLLGLAGLIPRKNKNRDHTTPPRAGGTGTGAHTSDRY